MRVETASYSRIVEDISEDFDTRLLNRETTKCLKSEIEYKVYIYIVYMNE